MAAATRLAVPRTTRPAQPTHGQLGYWRTTHAESRPAHGAAPAHRPHLAMCLIVPPPAYGWACEHAIADTTSAHASARAAVARESRIATRQLPAQGASGASRALARILPSRPWHSAKPRGSHHHSPTSGPRKLSTGPRQRDIGTHAPQPGPDCRRTASRDLVRWNPFSDGLLSVLPTNDAPQKLADTAMCLYGMVRGRRPLTTHTGRPPCSYQPHRVSQPPRIARRVKVATGLPR